MISVTAKNASCALVRDLNNIIISAVSSSTEFTSNLVSAVLKHYIMILLTLKASHNVIFLRISIDIVILIV